MENTCNNAEGSQNPEKQPTLVVDKKPNGKSQLMKLDTPQNLTSGNCWAMSVIRNKLSPAVLLLLVIVSSVAPTNTHAQTNTANRESYITSLPLEQLKTKAENGDAQAQYALAFRYFEGNGLGKDSTAAAQWYRKAADQGFAPAQCELGTLYRMGEGVDKSDTEAVKWFRKAAEQGVPGAQDQLGLDYESGKGVEQDET